MKQKTKKILNTAMATALSLGTLTMTTDILAKPKCAVEKCYGIVKKMKNDCGTPKHACAAQAPYNNDPADWMYVMKGNCQRIVGGSLKPMMTTKGKPGAKPTKKPKSELEELL